MDKIVKLKDGTYASVIREWNWEEEPFLKIYNEAKTERLYEDFIDIELDGALSKEKYDNPLVKGPKPFDSKFNHVYATVCAKDVEFINNL